MEQAFNRKMGGPDLLGVQPELSFRCARQRSLQFERKINAFMDGAGLFDVVTVRGDRNMLYWRSRIRKDVLVEKRRQTGPAGGSLAGNDSLEPSIKISNSHNSGSGKSD